jgi:PRC-barrel domain protein
MRRQSRWAAAALAAACIMAGFAASARPHHRAHRASHAVHASPSPVPATGVPSTQEIKIQEVNQPPAAGADAGKDGPPSSLGPRDAAAILGKSVHSTTGEDMGRLVDVVVDTDGRPRAAIIDFGGFLGVGSRKIAVDWAALKFAPGDPKGNAITVGLSRDQVKAAPEFKEGSPLSALGVSGSPQPAAPVPAPRPQAREK